MTDEQAREIIEWAEKDLARKAEYERYAREQGLPSVMGAFERMLWVKIKKAREAVANGPSGSADPAEQRGD